MVNVVVTLLRFQIGERMGLLEVVLEGCTASEGVREESLNCT
jgi:hypothetical protein